MDSPVLIDDTNPIIQYIGPWFTAQDTQLDTGNWGPPFQNTLHGVNVSASFSFPFDGSQVTLLGTIDGAGSKNPTWECFIDNNSIGSVTQLSRANNNQNLCQSSQLQDGPHVLTVNATVSSPLDPFWVDQITYLPSPNLSLAQATLNINANGSTVKYSSGWDIGPNTVHFTQTAGSTVTYEFLGVSISWVGYTPLHNALISSSATYSIDGQTPVNFAVPALTANDTFSLLNQVFFQTPQLSNGQHKLVVTHQGNSSTAPLALEYFVVNGTLSPSNSTTSGPGSSSGNNPTSSSAPSGSSDSTLNPGVISGVIIGSVFVLVITVFFSIRHWKKRRQRELSGEEPSPSVVHPLPVPQAPNHTSNDQSPSPTPHAPSKFSQGRNPPPDASPAHIQASTSALPPPSQIDPSLLVLAKPSSATGTTAKINTREVETVQQPTTAFLWHSDSAVRLPLTQLEEEGNVVEVPPSYTRR